MKHFNPLQPLALSVALASTWSHADIPQGPPRPESKQECVTAFDPAFKAHFARRSSYCNSCERITGFPGPNWTSAYQKCYRSCEEKGTDEFANLSQARLACYARVQSSGSQAIDIAQSAAVYDRANEMSKVMSSPKAFLESKINMPSEIMNMLRQKKNEPLQYDSLEAEIFKYSITQARAGIDAAQKVRGGSRIISTIQRTALDEAAAQFTFAINELAAMTREIDRTILTTPLRPPVAAKASNPTSSQSDQRCAELRDTARSAALQERDEALWQRLVESCTR